MSTPAHTEPKLLLVVDDDDDIREVAATALELVNGYRIITAVDGREALQQALEHRPDAILLDVMMPGMNGPEVVGILKRRPETALIPVILLTASVDGKRPEVDVEGLIAKPFDPMSLGAKVSRLLGWA